MDELLQGILLFVGGIVVIYMAWVKLNNTSTKGKAFQEVDGVVFDLHKSITHNLYYPVIRFVTKDGYWITQTLEDGFSPGIFKKGETVKVRYNKDEPKDFHIISSRLDIAYIITMIIGFCVIIVGVYKLWQGV